MRASQNEGAQLFAVRLAQWNVDSGELRAVRQAVFVLEQRIPEELEWDAADATCLHALAYDEAQRPIGCGRLLADGHIGRMAVLAAWRGQGVGGAVLELLVAEASRRGHAIIRLRAQMHALPFYARHGFMPEGEEFLEADIPHRSMAKMISPPAGT